MQIQKKPTKHVGGLKSFLADIFTVLPNNQILIFNGKFMEKIPYF